MESNSEFLGDGAFQFPDTQEVQLLLEKRKDEVDRLLTDFITEYEQQFGTGLTFRDGATDLIVDMYYQLLHNYVKPFVEDKANRFKMGSLTELAIVRVQPITEIEGGVNPRVVNAKLAMMAATALIHNIGRNLNNVDTDAGDVYFCDVRNSAVSEKVTDLLSDHAQWLEIKPLNEIPIVINAQFYEFLELMSSCAFAMFE